MIITEIKFLFNIMKKNFIKKFFFRFFNCILRYITTKNIFIFYPGLRLYLSCKIAGIKNIYHYPLFNKKNLHLVNAAKNFTKKSLKIENCPTETKIFNDHTKIEN